MLRFPFCGRGLLSLLFVMSFVFGARGALATDLNLIVQPILPPAKVKEAYEPLVKYLRDKTGLNIQLITSHNFLTYWETMKRGGKYDLILDGPHFTDFRTKRMGYKVLAKLKDYVSYSVVTREDLLILKMEELLGKKIATTPSPSQAALRLNQLFPHITRQPRIIGTADSLASIQMVLDKRADAAIVPSPLVRDYPKLNTAVTLESVPHMALSAARTIPLKAQQAIQKALIEAHTTPEGAAMLGQINHSGFETASAKTYDGYAQLLEGVWGY